MQDLEHLVAKRLRDLDSDEVATLERAAATLTAQLEREGVRSFCDSYHELLACVQTQR